MVGHDRAVLTATAELFKNSRRCRMGNSVAHSFEMFVMGRNLPILQARPRAPKYFGIFILKALLFIERDNPDIAEHHFIAVFLK